jgi:type II secretory pathway predicted ATPase ExeA
MKHEKYWGMEFNPFKKNSEDKNVFKSNDFNQMMGRFEHLKNTKGIGLFTGNSGVGKTFALKQFVNSLNKNMYKVIYISLSTISVLEFYKALADGLGLIPSGKKVDLYKAIQDRIISLVKGKKITPVVIIDEAQYLKTDVLNDIKLLLNFNMDSSNYVIFILNGQPILNDTLTRNVHESLKQRIVISYNAEGLTSAEMKEYLKQSLEISGIHEPILNENAYEAIYSCSNKSIRKVNRLMDKCLLISYSEQLREIDTNIVMTAQNEIELYS